VTIQSVYREKVPEINEEFTEKFDLPSPGEIQEMIRDRLENRMERQQESMKRDRAREALAESVDFDLPDSLVQQAARRERRRMVMQMVQEGRPVQEARAMADRMSQQSRDLAETNLKASFLLREVADQERLYVTESELAERMRAIGSRQGWDSRKTEKYFDEEDRKSNLRDNMKEEKALDFVLENANVREVDPEQMEEQQEATGEAGQQQTPDIEVPGT
jgi:trigger factor